MNKKSIIIFWVIIVAIVAIGYFVSNKKPASASYELITSTLKEINAKGIDVKEDSIGWNLGRYQTLDGKMIRIYRPGYSFVTTESEITDASSTIAFKFSNKFKELGFELDFNNSGDATVYGTIGYSKKPMGCIIRTEIIVDDPKDIREGVSYPIETSVSCADNVMWEPKATSTPATSTIQG
jgi:hypothetical protein